MFDPSTMCMTHIYVDIFKSNIQFDLFRISIFYTDQLYRFIDFLFFLFRNIIS